MALDSRSKKRPRVSCSSPNPIAITVAHGAETPQLEIGQDKFTPHADFWLGDGNLIILAGDTAFRVYNGLLVKKSTVFAALLSTSSSNATETFGGCSIVRLSDYPEDLADFLQYLMPCSHIRLHDGLPVSDFDELHAATHLARKYRCLDVETRALSILKRYYTSHFMDYAHFVDTKAALFRPPLAAAIAAVNIARLTETPSMLPLALYLVCNLEGDMIDGYQRRDGSVEYLATDDLRLCINARAELAEQVKLLVKIVFGICPGEGPTAGCMALEKCMAARSEFHEEMEMNRERECAVLTAYDDIIRSDPDLCYMCKKATLERELARRKMVWMMLPRIFGLLVADCRFAIGDEPS